MCRDQKIIIRKFIDIELNNENRRALGSRDGSIDSKSRSSSNELAPQNDITLAK